MKRSNLGFPQKKNTFGRVAYLATIASTQDFLKKKKKKASTQEEVVASDLQKSPPIPENLNRSPILSVFLR